jgi:hypothetical protein
MEGSGPTTGKRRIAQRKEVEANHRDLVANARTIRKLRRLQ